MDLHALDDSEIASSLLKVAEIYPDPSDVECVKRQVFCDVAGLQSMRTHHHCKDAELHFGLNTPSLIPSLDRSRMLCSHLRGHTLAVSPVS